jgi:serine/threonine-protein kinase/endoribonuclease IRE1
LPDAAKKELGTLPDGFLEYFTSRFPNLLISLVAFVESNPELLKDALFTQYFRVENNKHMMTYMLLATEKNV